MKKQEKDKFIQLAAGGKKMTGEVARMAEITPAEIERNVISAQPPQDIAIPTFNEEEAYASFLSEKRALRERYEPFLQNYAQKPLDLIQRIALKEFEYRKETEKDKSNFFGVLAGEGVWEKISLPHYVGPDGRWNAFYRTVLHIEKQAGKRYVLDFQAVDYVAEVYCNARLAVRHEGFFAPFQADVTDYVAHGDNIILIVVKNEVTTTGVVVDGLTHYGDKIYGATHFGYDEPNLGWHHCPAGAGIYGNVTLLVANGQRINDIFVEPDIDNGKITVRTTVYNSEYKTAKSSLRYKVEGRNFSQVVFETEYKPCSPLQINENYVTETFDLQNFRLWTCDQPYLYQLTVSLMDEHEKVLDQQQTHFGMRKFAMDENSVPKGAFYFNNQRIMLRGTNEMGHLVLAALKGDYEQLIDDILTAKVAHLNFYRMTQRPVLDEIYTYFDMLGMLCQSDFPLFSFLKPSALGEALKQVDEMELLTRNHPCVVVETFCNETLDKTAWGKEQYNLSRFEIEKFFKAAQEIVEIRNPKRVLKYCEGDYAPLENTHGISDFHCYTYWYVSHGMPSGKLRKGYLPPIRPDWMTGCGEFGVDGLDRLELMRKYCPQEWLSTTDDEPWSPKPIAKEQCYVLHGDFFPEQETAPEWIKASREWQAKAIKDYVHILRLRSDYIESTAVHLLIDAWPCGWTKTLVDVERIPKPAYYAFKESNILTRVSLRRDKFTVYAGDTLTTEIYGFNDLPDPKKVTVTATVYRNGVATESYFVDGEAKAVGTTYLGDIQTQTDGGFEGNIRIAVQMECDGACTYDEIEYVICPPMKKAKKAPLILSKKWKDISKICDAGTDENLIFLDRDFWVKHQTEIENDVFAGKTAVVFVDKPLNVLGEDIIFRIHTLEEEVRANNFVARSATHPYTKEFEETAFQNFYNAEKDYQDLTAWFKFEWKGATEILYTYEDCADPQYSLHKKHKMIMAEKTYGKGKLILTTLSAIQGCVGCNPVLDKLLINIVQNKE